ncbi:MAG: hypothetical protein M3R65_04050 [Gemmatimonadota bacterium]|nr:hypothetical protein [Gemmatimonadota bacterium]
MTSPTLWLAAQWTAATGGFAVVAGFALGRTSESCRRYWWLRAFGWLCASCTFGPFITALMIGVAGAPFAPGDALDRLGVAGSGILIVTTLFGYYALVFFALPYLPLFLLWGRLGPRLGWLELTRTGVCVSAALLALPGAVIPSVMYANMSAPFGFATPRELLEFGGTIYAATLLCIAAPRLLLPALAPGTFGASPATQVGPTRPGKFKLSIH